MGAQAGRSPATTGISGLSWLGVAVTDSVPLRLQAAAGGHAHARGFVGGCEPEMQTLAGKSRSSPPPTPRRRPAGAPDQLRLAPLLTLRTAGQHTVTHVLHSQPQPLPNWPVEALDTCTHEGGA
jgi:hypothetical protein